MPFAWSLNPYSGCAHRCTFCYVRAFERRADRPADDRYGRSIRVKVNVAEVLAREVGRRSWAKELVTIGAATDPYQPAEGRFRLTRACIEVFCRAASPFGLITRGPLIVRDLDVLADAARRTAVSVTFSVPTLDDEVWRTTEPGTAPPRQRLRALSAAGRGRDRGERRHGADPPRASPTGRSSWPPSSRQLARRARPASGRTCSTSLPGRRSTSSRRSRATGRSSSTATRSSTRAAPTSHAQRSTPCGSRYAALRVRTAFATAGRRR